MSADERCPRCDGRGVIPVERCSPRCALRHADDCPITVLVRCPTCETAELGDDLAWSAG